jgi:ketosteroid isomerase-like protein
VSEQQETVVRELFEAWNRRGGAETLRHFHDDVELDTRSLPQPDFQGLYHGLEGFGTWANTWLSAWEHIEQHPVWVESRGDRVAAWVRMPAIGKGSGIRLEEHGGWAFTFRDGKVSHIRLMVDEGETRRELDK